MMILPLFLPLLTCCAALLLWPLLESPPVWSIPWIEPIGIALAVRIDPLSWLFVAVIGVVGLAVFTFGQGYMRSYATAPRFWLIISVFYLAMLGIVVADDLIFMFICWELTSIMSYMLISFFQHQDSSRASALNALLVTGGGGLALLGGIIMLGSIVDTYSISAILAQSADLKQHPLMVPIAILFVLGAITKSAQFPFHFWLPGAMSAPAPVSALLHSATMVKAGVFLLLRMNPLFIDTDWYRLLLITLGAVTALYGAVLSLTHLDLKKILANTTISGLGILVMLIGVETPLALKGAMLFFVVHALYKSTLFMCTGIIDKCTGSRDISKLRGLRRVLPQVGLASLLAALSMAGVPLFIGFVGKEVIYESLLTGEVVVGIALMFAVLTNACIFAAGFVVTLKPFQGDLPADLKVKPASALMWTPPLLLGVAGVITGIALPWLSDLLTPVANQLMSTQEPIKLSLWHGVNLPLALSGLTVLLGVLCYSMFAHFQLVGRFLKNYEPYSGEKIFQRGIYGLIGFAGALTALVQNGKLRHYLAVMILFSAGLMGYVLWQQDRVLVLDFNDLQLRDIYAGVVIAVAALGAANTRSKLAGALELGVLGVGVTLFFILYGGPDLAMTQLLVEALIVILFVLVVAKLPNPHNVSSPTSYWRDAVIAMFVGVVMVVVMLKNFELTLHTPISEYYKQVSYLEAYGKNVVNVILVDFRAFDTLGEVLVLALAAMGIFVLIRYKRTGSKPAEEERS